MGCSWLGQAAGGSNGLGFTLPHSATARQGRVALSIACDESGERVERPSQSEVFTYPTTVTNLMAEYT
jgi:hypothetical protein